MEIQPETSIITQFFTQKTLGSQYTVHRSDANSHKALGLRTSKGIFWARRSVGRVGSAHGRKFLDYTSTPCLPHVFSSTHCCPQTLSQYTFLPLVFPVHLGSHRLVPITLVRPKFVPDLLVTPGFSKYNLKALGFFQYPLLVPDLSQYTYYP